MPQRAVVDVPGPGGAGLVPAIAHFLGGAGGTGGDGPAGNKQGGEGVELLLRMASGVHAWPGVNPAGVLGVMTGALDVVGRGGMGRPGTSRGGRMWSF